MSDLITPQINELINTPDVIEIVRDQVAALLSLEIKNQYTMAQTAGIQNIKDFEIGIYVENGRPYEASGDNIPMRFVNILLPKVIQLAGNSRKGNQKEQATIFIDCAACGNDSGNFRDEKSATFRAWRIARIVRRILMSDAYTYLGLRGTVGSRVIVSMEAGAPEKTELEKDAALSFVVVRISLEVQFLECFIANNGVPLEAIYFDVDPITGEVVVPD
jgi:hypothetical protein